MASFFVTGTDTGVGKTLVACALLHSFAAAGKSTVGMKPVAAGREGESWQDVENLMRAASVKAPRSLVNPYAFEPAIAPHIASELASTEIRLKTIEDAHDKLSGLADIIIIEGAGGFMIPLNEKQTSADLARALGAPMILVVGMRLGCLNHALLTRDAIAAAGLRCAGWIANCIVSDMPQLDRNIRSLNERFDFPLLGTVPFDPGVFHLSVEKLIS